MKTQTPIPATQGAAFALKAGDTITVTDVCGKQVADFFATAAEDTGEFLSPGVTIDCSGSLRVQTGSIIYTSRYRPMFEVVQDDVECHDLLFPSCRPEMYDFLYQSPAGHPNCFDNINAHLSSRGIQPFAHIQPFNIFMHTRVHADGSVTVEEPLSRAGDRITLKALMDVIICVAACSAAESKCNGGACTPLLIETDCAD
jgi:uncharacterized protein YcgI (DUF1989 family)